ncbi:unnamed protein product [Closterium sp. Naga37s-1]|nr:unnamed protein product [Closterium sp. Naga37s-1]
MRHVKCDIIRSGSPSLLPLSPPAAAVGALRRRGTLPGWREGPIFFAPTYRLRALHMRHLKCATACLSPPPAAELRWELSEGGALPGWREGPIYFAPTYKYAAGSNRYLWWELSEGGALPGWREGPIFFAPTYKYAAGSNRYVGEDKEDGEKRRTPAWCDRVLWYDSGDATDSVPPTSISSPSPSSNTDTTGITSSGSMSSSVGGYVSDALQLVSYSRAELALSDHRPVAAVFAVQVEAVERERFDAAVAVACRQLDERQHLAITHCSLSAHAVEFGEVPYASVIRRTIELHNLGTVPARFSVAPACSTDTAAPGPSGGCGAWVVAEPAAGAVAPGHTVTLSLHTWVAVPGTRVDLLVDRGGLLDLILVVAIAGGGDLKNGSASPSPHLHHFPHPTSSPSSILPAVLIPPPHVQHSCLKDPIRSLSLDAIATCQRSSLRHTRPTPAAAAASSIPEASETDPDNDNDSAAAAGEEDRPLGAAARAAAGAAGNPSHASDAFEVPKEVARMLTFLLDSGQDISSAFDPIALGIDLSLDQEDSTRAPHFPSLQSTPYGHPHSLSHTRSASLSSDVLSAAVSSLSTTPESSFNSNPSSSSSSSSPGSSSSSFARSSSSAGAGAGGVLPQLSRTLSRAGVAGLYPAATLAVAAAAGAVGAD